MIYADYPAVKERARLSKTHVNIQPNVKVGIRTHFGNAPAQMGFKMRQSDRQDSSSYGWINLDEVNLRYEYGRSTGLP